MALKVTGWDNFVRNRKRKATFDPWALRVQSNRLSFKQGGPYGALTGFNSHSHPVYPRPEVKYVDKDQTGIAWVSPPAAPSAITNTGTVVVLNTIAAGATSAQRIGQQVSIRNATYRYELDLPTNPVNQVPCSGRVMLIWDRQCNSNSAVFTDIFSIASYLSFMLPGASQRFVILRNQQFSLSPNGDQVLFFEGYININMLTQFSQTNNVPNTGALYLVYISDQATAANQPTIAGCFRTRYQDN